MSRTLLAARAAVTAAWTPADLAYVPELWMPPAGISGSPIDSIANAGTVGGSFVAAGGVRPAVGSINGVACPDFDGAANYMTCTKLLSDIAAAGLWHFFAVVDLDAIDTNAGNDYANDNVMVDSLGYWGVSLRSVPNVSGWHYSGGLKRAQDTIALSTPTLLESWYDGANIWLRVAGAAAVSSAAAGNIGTLTGSLIMGASYTKAQFLNGRVAEPISAKTNYTGADQTDLRDYYSTIYGVAA